LHTVSECDNQVFGTGQAGCASSLRGFLGEPEESGFVEGVMLEMKGINGILRMDLREQELRKLLQYANKEAGK
jgi:hypothetical protein